jgi:hypothetical protein
MITRSAAIDAGKLNLGKGRIAFVSFQHLRDVCKLARLAVLLVVAMAAQGKT